MAAEPTQNGGREALGDGGGSGVAWRKANKTGGSKDPWPTRTGVRAAAAAAASTTAHGTNMANPEGRRQNALDLPPTLSMPKPPQDAKRVRPDGAGFLAIMSPDRRVPAQNTNVQ